MNCKNIYVYRERKKKLLDANNRIKFSHVYTKKKGPENITK